MISEENTFNSKPTPNKVEDPDVAYISEKYYGNIVDHPLFAKVIEKSKKNHKEGNVFSHEEAMRIIQEKISLLK
jgi:hypothetical protein